MKTLIYLSLFLGWVSSSHAQGCPDYPRLLKEGDALRAKGQYRPALNKYNAARLCDPTQSTEIDKLIAGVFDDIEKKKEEAEKQRDIAQKATKEAKEANNKATENANRANWALDQALKQTDDANALYWSSEANRLPAAQAMQLLLKAAQKQKYPRTFDLIREKIETLFNQSNKQQFQEKLRLPASAAAYMSRYSPNGRWIAIRENNNTYSLYDLESNKMTHFLAGEKEVINVAFSPDSRLLLVDKDSLFKVYDTESWRCITTLDSLDKITTYSFSSDSKRIILESRNDSFYIFNTYNWEKEQYFDKDENIKSINFSPDGKWLSIEMDSELHKIFDLDNKRILVLNNDSLFKNANFSPDSKWLISEKVNNLIQIHSLSSGKEAVLSEKNSLIDVVFSNDGRLIFASLEMSRQMVIDTENFEKVLSINDKEHISKVFFSPNNRFLAVLNKELGLKIYDLNSNTFWTFPESSKFTQIKWSPNSDYLITKDNKNALSIYETNSFKQILLPYLRDQDYNWGDISYGLEDEIHETIFSKNGRWMAMGFFDSKNKYKRKYIVFDGKKKEFIKYLLFEDDIYLSQIFLLENKISIIQDGFIKFFNLESPSVIVPAFYDTEGYNLSYKGMISNKFILCNSGYFVAILDLQTGKFPSFLNPNSIGSYAVSRDSKWLAIVRHGWIQQNERTLEIYNLERGSKYNLFSGTTQSYGFSPNNKFLYNYYSDTIKIIRISDGEIVQTVNVGKSIEKIEFSEDSQWICLKKGDETSTIFDIETGKVPQLFETSTINNSDTLAWFIAFQSDGNRDIVFKPSSAKTMLQVQNAKDIFLKILTDTTHKYNKDTYFWGIAKLDSTFEVEQYSMVDLYKMAFQTKYCFFSSDSKWIYLANNYGTVFENGKFNNVPGFLQNEQKITMTYFSPDSQWMLIEKLDGTNKIFNLATKKTHNFLPKNKDMGLAKFSQNSQYITTVSNHKVITYELTTGKAIQTLWVNKKPTQIEIIDNRYLFVVVGKAIIKMDLQTQRGNFFSYGDGEPLDYTYEEIVEWMKVFGDEYLGPLSEEVKEKYGVK